MQTSRAVTVIPPTVGRLATVADKAVKMKNVAAYARVSTDSDEQLSSYEAQVDYYTRNIQSNNSWKFVEVYTDEGISATSTKKRDGFNRMIADALSGKIDLIITKSVSRFARNTVDTLTTVRRLKEKGVEIYFDKESAKLQNECEVVAELVRKCVEENASRVMNQKEYQNRYTGLVERYEEIKKAISENHNKRQERNAKKENIKDFIRMLEKNKTLLAEFDEELWNATLENVKVYQEQKLVSIFKEGLELEWNM